MRSIRRTRIRWWNRFIEADASEAECAVDALATTRGVRESQRSYTVVQSSSFVGVPRTLRDVGTRAYFA